jgi:hypothetical protein
MKYNIYCDESCHLEHDHIPVMVLGGVWVETEQVRKHAEQLRYIKSKHGIPGHRELKWTKVTEKQIALYRDVIDYFFDCTELHFRGVLIPDKSILRHEEYNQQHHEWYYKMMFRLLETILIPGNLYNIYLDYKDTRSTEKCHELWNVLKNAKYDHQGTLIHRVQPIRSHESELLQLTDLLIGAIGYANRLAVNDLPGTNQGKRLLVDRIRERSGKSLHETTWLREDKLNLLRWNPGEVRDV